MNNAQLAKLFPNGSKSFLAANAGLPNASIEPDEAPTLVSAIQGEKQSIRRVTVRFTLCRVRLLDRDASYASVKDTLDGLRHAGLIQDDSEEHIKLEVAQVKVAHRNEQKTLVKLIY